MWNGEKSYVMQFYLPQIKSNYFIIHTYIYFQPKTSSSEISLTDKYSRMGQLKLETFNVTRFSAILSSSDASLGVEHPARGNGNGSVAPLSTTARRRRLMIHERWLARSYLAPYQLQIVGWPAITLGS